MFTSAIPTRNNAVVKIGDSHVIRTHLFANLTDYSRNFCFQLMNFLLIVYISF